MTFVEVLPWDAPRDVWLAERRKGVGSSDIAVLLGLSNWDSPFGLYHRKTGTLGEQEELERMYWGRKLEAVIAGEYADRHPELGVARVGLCRSIERPYQQATPDRLLYDTEIHERGGYGGYYVAPWDYPRDLEPDEYPDPVGALEVKTDESMDGWGPDGSDEIPIKYRAQVLWQADCLGLPGIHVAALLPSKRYREYYIERDAADLKLMREAAEQFMDRIRRGDPPDVDGHPATIATLKQLHPDLEDTEAQVPKTAAEGYRRAHRNKRKADAHYRRWEANLRQRMGPARRAVDPYGDPVASRSIFERKPYEVGPSTVDVLRPAKEKP